ncbi:MAG: iron hydrogenase small subunit, partial [Clostridia bacterium]|nr:iron hydrogenase small subunit [Clostridia bacterium]
FDDPFAIGSSAGAIFGATGGVMEAALRYAAEVITGNKLEKLEFNEVRGVEGIKTASYKVGDLTVNVAVASGTGNAKKLLNMVKNGELDVQFIEIMGCPGGCVNGGGQPIQPASVRMNMDLRAVRAAVLYNDDANADVRKSQDNLAVQKIYDEFLGAPNSHKAHEILHTTYVKRGL